MNRPNKVAFVYWGRRGFSNTVLDIANYMASRPDLNIKMSVSSENELAHQFNGIQADIEFFRTFSSGAGALLHLPWFLLRVYRLVRTWKRQNVSAVVALMPHVWTPFLSFFLQRNDIKYGVVIHDADPHPGDPTAFINPWLYSDIARADIVFVLSRAVQEKLVEQRKIDPARIARLFLPVAQHSGTGDSHEVHQPLRALFFGRILSYKGLPLLVEAIELLRHQGHQVALGVVGEGDLAALTARLNTLNAEVVNRWVGYREIDTILSRYDVVVAPYIEASQSGVVASAFGAAKPVIVTPVGGLAEQVEHRITGLIAQQTTAASLATCLLQVNNDAALYREMVSNIKSRNSERSVDRFVNLAASLFR